MMCIQLPVFAQVGIGTVAPDATAALDVVSTTKGVLLPRLTDSDMNTLGISAGLGGKGLLIYNTDHHAFFTFDGVSWSQVGGTCIELVDENGDTKVEVERTSDADKINMKTAGTDRVVLDNTGVSVVSGNMVISNGGTLRFGGGYALPANDGPAGYVLGVGPSGQVEWRDPSAALGLVVGIETATMVLAGDFQNITSTIYYVRVMPWSNLRVTKMAFLFKYNGAGTAIPQLGIYDGTTGSRLTYGTGDPIPGFSTGPRIVEVPVAPATLSAGKVYWFAIKDVGSGNIEAYRQTFSSGTGFSSQSQSGQPSLPASYTFGSSTDLGFWISAY